MKNVLNLSLAIQGEPQTYCDHHSRQANSGSRLASIRLPAGPAQHA